MWKRPYLLHRHERSSQGGVRHIYPGGVYHPTPSIFQRLDEEGIRVENEFTNYSYRATYEFECYFDSTGFPPNNDKVQWIAQNVPLSVCVAANIPGHEDARSYATDSDSETLVAAMMTSDIAYDLLKPSYKHVFDKFKELQTNWDKATSRISEDVDEEGGGGKRGQWTD